ncbi:MAG: hypothetical protein IPH45_21690 [Bacteroidales bacterium]|nr:hypothetical protein [Bacteroidales bacterium]
MRPPVRPRSGWTDAENSGLVLAVAPEGEIRQGTPGYGDGGAVGIRAQTAVHNAQRHKVSTGIGIGMRGWQYWGR